MISRGKENVYRNKSKLGIARQKFCFMSGFIHKGNVYRLKVSNDNNLVA